MKSPGRRGKQGETDRQILQLLIANARKHPLGLSKTEIVREIEKTGIDREGVKRRITALLSHKDLRGVVVRRNISSRLLFSLNVMSLMDLAMLYVFLEPIETKDVSMSLEINDYFLRNIRNFLPEFVDYLRLWNPFGDGPLSLPDEFKDEIFGRTVTGEPHIWELPENTEYFRLEDGKMIADNEHPDLGRELLTFDPERYPGHGTEPLKLVLKRWAADRYFPYPFGQDLIDYLALVYEFHKYATEQENEFENYFDDMFFECEDEAVYDTGINFKTLPPSISSPLYAFLDDLKRGLKLSEETLPLVESLPAALFPYVSLKWNGGHAYWQLPIFWSTSDDPFYQDDYERRIMEEANNQDPIVEGVRKDDKRHIFMD